MIAPLVAADGLQEGVRADDVGVEEGARVVQRVVVVGLGGEVHDEIVGAHQAVDQGRVADVALHQGAALRGQPIEGPAVAGVGQPVEDGDLKIRVRQRMSNEVGSDEAGTAGHEQSRHGRHRTGPGEADWNDCPTTAT